MREDISSLNGTRNSKPDTDTNLNDLTPYIDGSNCCVRFMVWLLDRMENRNFRQKINWIYMAKG